MGSNLPGQSLRLCGHAIQVEFKRVEIQQIVGNHEMKRKLKQLAQTVVAYDFERKMNPMMDLAPSAFKPPLSAISPPGTIAPSCRTRTRRA